MRPSQLFVVGPTSVMSMVRSFLLATGTAVKAFPLALFPALARDEPNPRRAALAAANRAYRERPALWERDASPEGFAWIDPNDVDDNVLSFIRLVPDGSTGLVCIANLSPVPRTAYRIGLPWGGEWR